MVGVKLATLILPKSKVTGLKDTAGVVRKLSTRTFESIAAFCRLGQYIRVTGAYQRLGFTEADGRFW